MQEFLNSFRQEASRALIDRERELELALCCFLAGGHLLIEDTPGVGKTTLVKVLARLLGLDFKRVQFTNDLLPADILGSQVYDATRQTFTFHRGPLFGQLVLGDELNRASPRTQSATLQAMEEYEVTIEGAAHALPRPFFFVGTQNPREHAGTAPLPESQIDRFLMRIEVGAPQRETQRKLLARERIRHGGTPFDFAQLRQLTTPDEFMVWQTRVSSVHVAEAVSEYILDLFENARERGWPLSPRATIGLQRASQAQALLRAREHVLPADVQEVFTPVVAHRLTQYAVNPGDTRESARMARTILDQTDVR